jgi:hypothetical protein
MNRKMFACANAIGGYMQPARTSPSTMTPKGCAIGATPVDPFRRGKNRIPRLCGHHASRNVDPQRGEAGGPALRAQSHTQSRPILGEPERRSPHLDLQQPTTALRAPCLSQRRPTAWGSRGPGTAGTKPHAASPNIRGAGTSISALDLQQPATVTALRAPCYK